MTTAELIAELQKLPCDTYVAVCLHQTDEVPGLLAIQSVNSDGLKCTLSVHFDNATIDDAQRTREQKRWAETKSMIEKSTRDFFGFMGEAAEKQAAGKPFIAALNRAEAALWKKPTENDVSTQVINAAIKFVSARQHMDDLIHSVVVDRYRPLVTMTELSGRLEVAEDELFLAVRKYEAQSQRKPGESDTTITTR